MLIDPVLKEIVSAGQICSMMELDNAVEVQRSLFLYFIGHEYRIFCKGGLDSPCPCLFPVGRQFPLAQALTDPGGDRLDGHSFAGHA